MCTAARRFLNFGDGTGPAPAMRTLYSMAAIRILVVDDEPIVGLSIKLALDLPGYSIDLVARTEEALAKFAAVTYDVVVTDFLMPGMTGVQLAEQLKSRSPSVKIVLVSGSPPPSLTAIDHVMLKPFSIEALRSAIADLLQGGPNRT
jgi:CheY-like chemotaxis protein